MLIVGAVATLALSAANIAEAQSQSTALLLSSQADARGSSRYQALSGAMGAVGVDFSSVHQNPAGISYFRSGTKVSATLNYGMNSSSNTWYGNKTDLSSQGRLYFDELSYQTNWSLGSGKNLTLAFGVQNNGRLNRRLDAFTGSVASGLGSSVSSYVAAITNGLDGIKPIDLSVGASGSLAWNRPWISPLGYSSKWIDADIRNDERGNPYHHYSSQYGNNPLGASLIYDERGGLSNYDIAVGLELSNSLSLGFLGTLSSMDYEAKTFYKEDFAERNDAGQAIGLSLDNSVRLSGFGARLGVGVLFRPIDGLRLGAGIYTPNLWSYKMVSDARATGVDNSKGTNSTGRYETGTPVSETSFRFTTPWRFTLSGAYVFDRTAILSLDYEYQNFGGARLLNSLEDDYETSRNVYEGDNEAIKSDFGGQHTLRAGLEINATKRLALRGGFRYSTAPKYDADLNKEVPSLEQMVPSTQLHYRLLGAIQSYSVGIGYRLSPAWTLDLAYVYRHQTDKVAAYPSVRDVANRTIAEPKGEKYLPLKMIEDKQVQSSLSATISYRF